MAKIINDVCPHCAKYNALMTYDGENYTCSDCGARVKIAVLQICSHCREERRTVKLADEGDYFCLFCHQKFSNHVATEERREFRVMQKREEENVYTSREVADMVRFPFRIALYALVSWQGFNYIATAASLPAVGFWHSLGLVSILAYLVALVKGAGNAKKE